MKINVTGKIATSFVLLLLFLATVQAAGGPVKILDNGPNGSKLVFAILGDGYAAGSDQQKYKNDVATLVLEGLLGHDFFRDSRSAFNVYRFDLISKDSGITTPGVLKDTALKLTFTNDQSSCYFQSADDTDKLIDKAVAGLDKYPDYVLVIANEDGYGGCHPGGNRLYVTSGSGWKVVAHEYGHAIGDLFDEYWNNDAPAYSGQSINVLNCSTELDKNRLSWKGFVAATLNIPPATELGPAVGFIPRDAFVSRGFMTDSAGEKVEPARSVTIAVNVVLPGKTVNRDFCFRIYKLRTDDQFDEINESVLRRLKSQQLVSLEVEIPASKINAALKRQE